MNFRYLMTTYRLKSGYNYWLGFQLLILVALIVSTIFNYEKNSSHVLKITKIEAIFTIIFTLEIALRIYIAKRQFLASMWNVLDLINLTFIIGIFGLSHTFKFDWVFIEYSEIIPLTLLGMRYFSQALRIILDLRATYSMRKAATMEVTFDHHEDEHHDEVEKVKLCVH